MNTTFPDADRISVVTEKDLKYREKTKNEREFFRLNDHVKIEVRALENAGNVSECRTSDISAGGLQFFSGSVYRDGMLLEISCHLEDRDPDFEPLRVYAKVVKAGQVRNSHYYNVSVKYIDVSQKDRSLIEHYIFVRQRKMIAERRVGFL